jgi:hypothetical protein
VAEHIAVRCRGERVGQVAVRDTLCTAAMRCW